MTPNNIGLIQAPARVSTLRDAWWKSRCQSADTCSTSKLRTSSCSRRSRAAMAPSVARLGLA